MTFLVRLSLPLTSKSAPLANARLQLTRKLNSLKSVKLEVSLGSVENNLASMCLLSREATTELYCGS